MKYIIIPLQSKEELYNLIMRKNREDMYYLIKQNILNAKKDLMLNARRVF